MRLRMSMHFALSASRAFAVVLSLSLAVTAAACSTPSATEHFRHPESGGIKRAAYEMECPADQLHITDLGNWTIAVEGCGKKAIYKAAMGVGWINNTGHTEEGSAKAKR
jgi:hypothetical protein